MGLTAPLYSFIQTAQPATGCTFDPSFCLPCSDPTNLSFQMTATGVDTDQILDNYTYVSTFYTVAVPPDATCRTDTQTSGFTSPGVIFNQSSDDDFTGATGTITGSFNKVNTATNSYLIPGDTSAQINVGECFKLQFILDVVDGTTILVRYWLGCSNCLIRINQSECYTSLLGYRNTSDSFGFKYQILGSNIDPYENYFNVVELPMYLRDPRMENDQKVYTRSDGTLVKLYERKEEIYMLETDLMPYAWHKSLDIALSHDDVYISNPNAAGFDPFNTATQFAKKENYEIEYQKAPLSSLGKGSCKLSNATPISLINNNCG